jgi:hypothetical protein
MPIDYTRYPKHWHAFSHWIRHVRAQGQCECTGQCHLHTPNPTTRRCQERNRQPALFARGTITLTVAHLCHCDPPCAIPAHVIAACQRCHLRIDRKLHALHKWQNAHPDQLHLLTPAQQPETIHARPIHPKRDTRRRF